MNKESKINLIFDDNEDNLQKIIDEILLNIYVNKKRTS